MADRGEIALLDNPRPIIYMIPNGKYCGHKDFNPFDLFHDLPRKTRVT